MAKMHASFERWWNGISLRTKITGVTVLLLTFGLAVAGMGTMTVLRTYLLEKVDANVTAGFQQAQQELSPGDGLRRAVRPRLSRGGAGRERRA